MSEETISYWNKTAKIEHYPRLDKSLETDILIIGGGITGITCAYCLALKGAKPVLIEADGLCNGTTGNTTGKVTIQHDIIYSKISDKHGMDFAKLYAESQADALDFVKNQINQGKFDCQLAENTAYIFASSKDDQDTVKKEYDVAKKLGIDTEYIENPDFPPNNFGMLGFRHQAVFHPVRYADALAKEAISKGAKIHCDTKATKVEDGDIKTVYCENDIVIKAKHLVMATQFPIYDGPNIFFTRLYAKRAYGIAVKAKRDWPDGSYISSGEPTRSIRTHVENGKRILIVVGENHATARGEENMELHYENLIQYAEHIAGVDGLLAKWSAQDYDTPDQIPYIGRLSDNSNIYVAAGFKKWGLSNGTLAGNMISELILNGNCRYEELYSRKRGDYSSSMAKTISEVFGSVGELIKSKLKNVEGMQDLKQGEGRVINFEGQKAGIYRDFDDHVTVLDISCTHMTTELNFNTAEKTWDCPAHGGRFAASNGKLLEGPPKDSLQLLYQGKFTDFVSAKDR
ncbi:MAG: FAD-dependent oxidoreductase [Lachnospiraceae bacterium]|nr:FAD-dependent oxidoreductase [Lachnospiraceae bacterium]